MVRNQEGGWREAGVVLKDLTIGCDEGAGQGHLSTFKIVNLSNPLLGKPG
jgi:hypothetical protein